MDVGLADHRVQRPIHPPARGQQGGEERAGPGLGDLHGDVPGRRGHQLLPAPVALGRALGGALMLGGADVGGGLRLDQVLQRRAQQLAHHIAPVGLLQHTEQGQ